MISAENASKTISKYSQTNEKLFMTMEEVFCLSQELSRRIGREHPQIEKVVGIANGAAMMTKIIADELDLSFDMVRIRRNGSFLKDRLEKFPGVRKIASLIYGIPILNWPMVQIMQWLNRAPIVESSESALLLPKKVVLIDDVIDSGQSVLAAIDILSNSGATDITCAVMVWSDWAERRGATPLFEPDYYIGRRVQHFPWSKNNPNYQEYCEWIAANGFVS
jgi:hypoxanthine phosphoribosyltransferase